MNDALASEVSIETLPPMRVACYRAASLTPEEDGAKYILDWWRQQSSAAAGRLFGFDVDVTPEQQKDGLRGYEYRLCVPPEVQPSDGVTCVILPAVCMRCRRYMIRSWTLSPAFRRAGRRCTSG